MAYVIRSTETGWYVAPAGSAGSYTNRLEKARTWESAESATRELCPENERVVSVDSLLRR